MATGTINVEKVGVATNISTYLNSWINNGASFYQKIGNMAIINCSIRNGTLTDGVKILQLPTNMYPASNALATAFNLNTSAPNGYALINVNGELTINKATSNTSVVFTLLYRCN